MDLPLKQKKSLSLIDDGQISIYCPDCRHYYRGVCGNPFKTLSNDYCPFEEIVEVYDFEEEEANKKIELI